MRSRFGFRILAAWACFAASAGMALGQLPAIDLLPAGLRPGGATQGPNVPRLVRFQPPVAVANENEKENGAKSEDANGNGKDCENGCKADRPAKTLLSWNFGPEAEEDEGDEEEPLAADRPDFVEASSNVGLGRIQLEAGYTFSRDRSNGVTVHGHSYPEAVLRLGLFADWFELRIGQNFGTVTARSDDFRDSASGADDLYLGVGLALTEQKGVFPESRIVLQMTVPTGVDAFSSDRVMPGFNYLYGWDVIPDRVTFGGSTQINRALDDVGHYYAEVAQAGTMGVWFTPKLGSYYEFFGLFPCGAIDSGPEYYFDSGLVYRVTNNLQLDVRAGVGLNRRATDFFTGTGFAVRY